MAFRDQIRKYKLGGNMAQSSEEELQGLASNAEQPTTPSNPLAASTIGANPNQAKMAGSSAQKTSALRVAIQQDKNLGDVQRTDQARQGLTAEEQASGQKGQKAQSLNSLNDRVQNITQQMLQSAQGSTVAQMQVNPSSLSAFAEENKQEASDLLTKLGTNQATNQDILRLNQLMGKTSIDQQLSADQLKQNFLSAGSAAGKSLATATADQIKVTDLDPVALGFTDTADLAAVLGVDPAELEGMSLKELQDQAQTLFNDEFNKTQSLETRSQDINLGPAERAEARKELKDMGATGVAKSEAGIDKLADQVANSDTVNFAGQELKVQDVLSDEYLSGLAARYVDADDNDPFIKELKESEPELSKWLDDNKEVLRQATADLDEDVKTFSDLQFQNQKLKTFSDLPNLEDSVMKQILPDWGELRSDAYNIDEVPALKLMQDTSVPQVTRANVRNAFDQFNAATPQLTKDLARLNPEQLDQLGATGGAGNTKWQSVSSYLKDVSNLNSINPAQPDTVASFILGPGKTAQDLMDTARAVQARARSGMFGSSPIPADFQNILNTNDPAQIAEYLKQNFSNPNIANLVNQTPFSASQTGQGANTYKMQGNEVFNLTEKYFNDHENLTDADTADLARKPLDLEKVYASSLNGKMTDAAKKNVQSDFEFNYVPEYNNKLLNSKLYTVQQANSLANKQPGKLSTDEVLQLDGTYTQMQQERDSMDRNKNPLQYEFLSQQMDLMHDKVKAHMDAMQDELFKTIGAGDKTAAAKIVEAMANNIMPGGKDIRMAVSRALGIDEDAIFSKIARKNPAWATSLLSAVNATNILGNAGNEGFEAGKKLIQAVAGKKATKKIFG